MTQKAHWEKVYTTKATNSVSWYQENPSLSLELIKRHACVGDEIIDVGGGASFLCDVLFEQNYHNITILDLSAAALKHSQKRLGQNATKLTWIAADITKAKLQKHHYDLWHDRAVFHFLTQESERQAYVQALTHSIKPDGHLILATFAETGPKQCSGLPVVRYNVEGLSQAIGASFELISWQDEVHDTPFQTEQQFIYCVFKRKS